MRSAFVAHVSGSPDHLCFSYTLVAFAADLATAVFGVFADELARWQRERASKTSVASPETACLLEIQRFADGARLYPHAHA